jgi:hypothetical protein
MSAICNLRVNCGGLTSERNRILRSAEILQLEAFCPEKSRVGFWERDGVRENKAGSRGVRKAGFPNEH